MRIQMMNRSLVVGLLLLSLLSAARAAEYQIFARTNLMAWCIVPFDCRKRTPEERIAMLERLGFKGYAYDWRAEHLPEAATHEGVEDTNGVGCNLPSMIQSRPPATRSAVMPNQIEPRGRHARIRKYALHFGHEG